MKVVKIFCLVMIVGIFSVIFIGCGPSPGKKLEIIAEKACTCADKSCAEGVLNDYKNIVDELKDVSVGESEYKRIEEASKKALICLLQKGIAAQKIRSMIQ